MAGMITQSNYKLSMREKSLLNRRINKEHGSNLRAGYVHVTEDHLRKTGLRGHKLYFVYMVIVLLVIFAVANVIVTIYILKTIRLGLDGIESLQFTSPGKLLSFKKPAEMNNILLVENTLSDDGNGLELVGTDHSRVSLETENADGTTLTVTEEDVTISNVEKFLVIDPNTGHTVFSTNFNEFQFPSQINSITAVKFEAEKVSSPKGSDLGIITADTGKINVTGNTEVHFQGNSLSISSRHLIHLLSSKSLLLSSKTGVYLRDVRNLAKVPPKMDMIPERLASTYRLCVCAANGRLFEIPGQDRCDQSAKSAQHLCLQ